MFAPVDGISAVVLPPGDFAIVAIVIKTGAENIQIPIIINVFQVDGMGTYERGNNRVFQECFIPFVLQVNNPVFPINS